MFLKLSCIKFQPQHITQNYTFHLLDAQIRARRRRASKKKDSNKKKR